MKINKLFEKVCKKNGKLLKQIYIGWKYKLEGINSEDYLNILNHYIPEVFELKAEKPFGVLLKADDGNFCIQIDEDGKDIVFKLMEVCYSESNSKSQEDLKLVLN